MMAGHDINYIALAGVLGTLGRAGEAPVPPINLVGDFGGGGMLLAVGICAALGRDVKSGQGSGHRRGHDRRLRAIGHHDPLVRRQGHLGRARHQPARHGRALLRRVRDAPTASTSRSARSSRSSTPSSCVSPAWKTKNCRRRWTDEVVGAEGADGCGHQDQEP